MPLTRRVMCNQRRRQRRDDQRRSEAGKLSPRRQTRRGVGGAFSTATTFIFQLSNLSNVRLSLQRPSSCFLTGLIGKKKKKEERSDVLIIHTVPPVAIGRNAHNVRMIICGI